MNPPVSTQSILYAIARRMGLVPDENLSPDQGSEILQSMDDRLREGWESYDFIENTTTEERAFRNDYNSDLCYCTGDVVWDPGTRSYYQAVLQGVGGPLSNSAVWAPLPSVSPAYVEWWQVGKTPIGTAFEAYQANPYEDVNAKKRPFVISPRGLEFVPDGTATVWVYFRYPYPGLGQQEWSAASTYALGDPVLGSDGHTYISLTESNSNNNPLAAGTVAWRKFPVPYIFSRFVVTASFSDTLVTNGQNEKAQLEVQKAYSYLNSEYDKQRLQQGQEERFSVNVR